MPCTPKKPRATHPGADVLAVLDAGRGELYGAVYAGDGSEIVAPAAAPAEYFAAQVAPGMVIAGSGADAVAALLTGTPPVIAHRRASVDVAALCRLGESAPRSRRHRRSRSTSGRPMPSRRSAARIARR